MGFGGEGEYKSNAEQAFEGGTNVYQKPTPKQDKADGIIPAGEGARFWP